MEKSKQDGGQTPPGSSAEEPRVLQIADAADETKSLTITLCPDVKEDDAATWQTRIDEILQARIDAEAKIVDLNKQIEQLTGAKDGADSELETLRQKVSDLETAQTTLDDGLDERMIALADERAVMIAFMADAVPDYAHQGKSIAQMRRDALEAYFDDLDLKGKSDDYIAGRFEQLKDSLAEPVGDRQMRSTNDGDDTKDVDPRQNLHRDPSKAAAQSTG